MKKDNKMRDLLLMVMESDPTITGGYPFPPGTARITKTFPKLVLPADTHPGGSTREWEYTASTSMRRV